MITKLKKLFSKTPRPDVAYFNTAVIVSEKAEVEGKLEVGNVIRIKMSNSVFTQRSSFVYKVGRVPRAAIYYNDKMNCIYINDVTVKITRYVFRAMDVELQGHISMVHIFGEKPSTPQQPTTKQP